MSIINSSTVHVLLQKNIGQSLRACTCMFCWLMQSDRISRKKAPNFPKNSGGGGGGGQPGGGGQGGGVVGGWRGMPLGGGYLGMDRHKKQPHLASLLHGPVCCEQLTDLQTSKLNMYDCTVLRWTFSQVDFCDLAGKKLSKWRHFVMLIPLLASMHGLPGPRLVAPLLIIEYSTVHFLPTFIVSNS